MLTRFRIIHAMLEVVRNCIEINVSLQKCPSQRINVTLSDVFGERIFPLFHTVIMMQKAVMVEDWVEEVVPP